MSAVLCAGQAAPLAVAPAAAPFRLTLFTSAKGLLTKRLAIGPDGTLQKEPAANMHEGMAELVELADLHELDALLQRVTSSQAIGQGIASKARVKLVTERRERATTGAISRTQRHFQFPAGPGFMLLDHDGMPGGESLDADQLRQRIVTAVPELAEAPMLIRQSVSAGVRGPGGDLLTPYGKWHAYLPVLDASLIPDAAEALELRLWAAGLGWYEVSASGAALRRTLVDLTVLHPERLDFCSAPVLGEGLTQEWLPSRFYGDPAAAFDLARIAVDSAAAARAADNQLAARAAVAQRCQEQRAAWEATRASVERPKTKAATALARSAKPRPEHVEPEALALVQGDGWATALLARLPRAPWSADDFEADMRIRRLERALEKANLQVNLPTARLWLTFDVDQADAARAWERAGLPPPTWTATNRESGHAHIAWGLAVPVLMGCEAASEKALRYLRAVEGCFAARLGADPGYHGLTTKNPLHAKWDVSHGERLQLYTLGELADCLPELPTYRPPRKAQEQVGVGRAVHLFNGLRKWAVRAIRQHWGGGPDEFDAWASHCTARAVILNGEFSAPLEWREVRHAARCVARWTWKRTTRAGFSAWQSERGKESGAARRAASEPKRKRALELHASGMSQRAIATELEVNQSTVARWLKAGDA